MGREIAIKLSAEKFSDRCRPNYLVMELVEGPTLAGSNVRSTCRSAESQQPQGRGCTTRLFAKRNTCVLLCGASTVGSWFSIRPDVSSGHGRRTEETGRSL
jgi:hypothetical protein